MPLMKLVTHAFMRNPYPALHSLREASPPVAPIVANGFRQWVVTRHGDVRRVLGDRSFRRDVRERLQGSNKTLVAPERAALLSTAFRRGLIDRDDADHDRLRTAVSGDLTLARAEELLPRIREVAGNLLDDLPLGEPVDLVGRYTRPLSATIISEVVGVPPHERQRFPDWENSLLTGTSREEIVAGGEELYALCKRVLEIKRHEPQDDVATRLVRAQEDGCLDADEAASTLGNLIIGGMEPSTAIGTGIALLLTHTDQLTELLADFRLLPRCVEEIVRFDGPFRILGPRFADQELGVDGLTIPPGELIALCPAAANRDPRRFSDPDTFDIARHPNPHLGFGYGSHHCIGVHLGRHETAAGLEAFLTHFSERRLAVAWEELSWRPGYGFRRLASLPVVLGDRADADKAFMSDNGAALDD